MCWIPIFKAKKLILAGDPKQLPPTILSVDKANSKVKPPSTEAVKGKQKPQQKPPATEKDPSVTNAEEDAEVQESSSSASEGESDDENKDDVEQPPPAKKPSSQKKRRKQRPRQGLKPPRSLEITLFDRLERMYGPPIKRMLNVQYR